MQYPKLTIGLTLLAIVLGQALFADSPRESLLYRTADGIEDVVEPAVERANWYLIRWRAHRGDACAIGQVAWAHQVGHQMVGVEYSGLKFDREKARQLFRRSIDLGCEQIREQVLMFDLLWPDPLTEYRDDEGRVEWQQVQAAASTGDPHARYAVARSMMQSQRFAEQRGVDHDPERAAEMLSRLADERHMDAMMDLAREGSGITPELNRAYYALMDTTWKVLPTLRIHMRFLAAAIDGCNPSAWAKAMDIWSTLSLEVHESDFAHNMLGDAHERYLSTCSGPGS